MHISNSVRTRLSFRFVLGLIACSTSASAQTPCQLEWVPGFGGTAGLSSGVQALCAFDDGSGPALYAGGYFVNAGGLQVNGIARWDGFSWYGLASGVDYGDVFALAGADLGSGPHLYAAGTFIHAGGVGAIRIAQWNGNGWSGLGLGLYTPVQHPAVYCLESYDFGSGPALYAGGTFTWAGNVQASRIAKWDGSAWSALGSGVNTEVRTCAGFDDGSGPALYVGGDFWMAGGSLISYVARWDGTSWSSVGAPLDDPVRVLKVIDDGSGPALYAGGSFTVSGGVALNGIGKWDGANWQPVGGGFALGTAVAALVYYDDGSGPALFAAGPQATAGGVILNNIAKWDGANWLPVGSGFPGPGGPQALAGFDAGSDRGLYAAGSFSSAGSVPSSNIAKWAYTPDCGQPAVEYCFPGAGGVTSCPCGNPPVILGTGCDNSSGTGGAVLWATGQARLSYDTVLLRVNGERPTATSIVLQGSSDLYPGAIFGQGVRCVGGSLKRLYVKTAVAGSIAVPVAGDMTIAARSAALGDTIVAGTHRYYGVYYRDPNILGGCPASSGFNITEQLDILWTP